MSIGDDRGFERFEGLRTAITRFLPSARKKNGCSRALPVIHTKTHYLKDPKLWELWYIQYIPYYGHNAKVLTSSTLP